MAENEEKRDFKAEFIELLQSSTSTKTQATWAEQAESVRAMNSALIDTIENAVSRSGWTPELVALFSKASACAKTWTVESRAGGEPTDPGKMTEEQLRKAAGNG
jgi:hypothetical protein